VQRLVKLSYDSLLKIINASNIAISQLGKDIIDLDKEVNERWKYMDQSIKSVNRDIKDRWVFLSSINKDIVNLKKKLGKNMG